MQHTKWEKVVSYFYRPKTIDLHLYFARHVPQLSLHPCRPPHPSFVGKYRHSPRCTSKFRSLGHCGRALLLPCYRSDLHSVRLLCGVTPQPTAWHTDSGKCSSEIPVLTVVRQPCRRVCTFFASVCSLPSSVSSTFTLLWTDRKYVVAQAWIIFLSKDSSGRVRVLAFVL